MEMKPLNDVHPPVSLQNRIAISRQYRCLSQPALAELLSVALHRLASWEAGEATPTVEEAIRLSKALDLPLTMLFYRE